MNKGELYEERYFHEIQPHVFELRPNLRAQDTVFEISYRTVEWSTEVLMIQNPVGEVVRSKLSKQPVGLDNKEIQED